MKRVARREKRVVVTEVTRTTNKIKTFPWLLATGYTNLRGKPWN